MFDKINSLLILIIQYKLIKINIFQFLKILIFNYN